MNALTSSSAISSANDFLRVRIGLSTGIAISLSCLFRIRRDGDDAHLLADLECLELDVFFAFQLLDELDECLVADHIDALDVAGGRRGT